MSELTVSGTVGVEVPVPTTEQIGTGNPSGAIVGVSGGKLALYGGTPVGQAAAISFTSTTNDSTEVVNAITAIIAAIGASSGIGITA